MHSVVAEDPSFLHVDSEDSDQTRQMPRLISDQSRQMPRLISVFAGRTCHFVGFVMRLLILKILLLYVLWLSMDICLILKIL